MRKEWLKDLLAVAETGSFQTAAAARGVTQPAFSRRLRQIEAQLGAPLFDRAQRPARLLPHVLGRLEQMRELSDGMTGLTHALRQGDRGLHNRLEIACQHAIAISVVPGLMERLRASDLHVRMRSANREDCLAQLLIGRVDLAFVYNAAGQAMEIGSDAVDRAMIASDRLVPVFSAGGADALNLHELGSVLPIVAYPRDVFLGRVFWNQIAPRLSADRDLVSRIETALTPAAMQCALSGLGVSWLPHSLVAAELDRGTLIDLSTSLPAIGLDLFIVRRLQDESRVVETVWRKLIEKTAS